jgi:hypothetical protein
MKKTHLMILTLILWSGAVLIQMACSSGSSGPTEPEAPSLAASQASQTGNSSQSSGSAGSDVEMVSGPGVFIEKSTNGFDADTEPGPSIEVGEEVQWTYVVTNIGDVPLVSVLVEDDQEGEICRRSNVAPEEVFRCSRKSVAIEGQYANVATVTATDGNTRVTATDPSHYLGNEGGRFAAVQLEKSTNGEDADYPVGPIVLPGSQVDWVYVVSNIGDVPLVEWLVTDDQIAGDICRGRDLAPGDSFECPVRSARAIEGQYANIGLVQASDGRQRISDEDASHYFGSVPIVEIDKKTDGMEGPTLTIGCPVTWTYDVFNRGNIELRDISVVDSPEGPIRCPKNKLAVGDDMQCVATGTVGEAAYTNTVTVNAFDPAGNPAPEATDSDGYRVERVKPDCSTARASVETIWPANHKMVDIEIVNLTDTCDRAVMVTIEGITQDEPVNDVGDGSTGPDASGVGTDTAQVRAERSGTGDGRVYEISFSATAGGATCSGQVKVGVPHDKKDIPVDSGQQYDSTRG